MALISKILEGVLASGATSISFTDADIPNSFIRIGSTDPDLMPVSQSLTGNTLTITYEAQSSSKGIVVNLVKAGISVIDALTSDDADNALSAKQGKALKTLIDGLSVPALTDLTDVDFTSLTDGDIIVYDGINQKFINNSMPSIPSNITDLDDVVVTDITDGQVLAWDDEASKFVNVDQAGGASYPVIKKDWIASSSSVTGSALTDIETLPAGKYIINVRLPYSTLTGLAVFALGINSAIDYTQLCSIPISYGNCSFIVEKNESFTIKFVSGSGNTLTWDSAYLDRGAMYILRIS